MGYSTTYGMDRPREYSDAQIRNLLLDTGFTSGDVASLADEIAAMDPDQVLNVGVILDSLVRGQWDDRSCLGLFFQLKEVDVPDHIIQKVLHRPLNHRWDSPLQREVTEAWGSPPTEKALEHLRKVNFGSGCERSSLKHDETMLEDLHRFLGPNWTNDPRLKTAAIERVRNFLESGEIVMAMQFAEKAGVADEMPSDMGADVVASFPYYEDVVDAAKMAFSLTDQRVLEERRRACKKMLADRQIDEARRLSEKYGLFEEEGFFEEVKRSALEAMRNSLAMDMEKDHLFRAELHKVIDFIKDSGIPISAELTKLAREAIIRFIRDPGGGENMPGGAVIVLEWARFFELKSDEEIKKAVLERLRDMVQAGVMCQVNPIGNYSMHYCLMQNLGEVLGNEEEIRDRMFPLMEHFGVECKDSEFDFIEGVAAEQMSLGKVYYPDDYFFDHLEYYKDPDFASSAPAETRNSFIRREPTNMEMAQHARNVMTSLDVPDERQIKWAIKMAKTQHCHVRFLAIVKTFSLEGNDELRSKARELFDEAVMGETDHNIEDVVEIVRAMGIKIREGEKKEGRKLTKRLMEKGWVPHKAAEAASEMFDIDLDNPEIVQTVTRGAVSVIEGRSERHPDRIKDFVDGWGLDYPEGPVRRAIDNRVAELRGKKDYPGARALTKRFGKSKQADPQPR